MPIREAVCKFRFSFFCKFFLVPDYSLVHAQLGHLMSTYDVQELCYFCVILRKFMRGYVEIILNVKKNFL